MKLLKINRVTECGDLIGSEFINVSKIVKVRRISDQYIIYLDSRIDFIVYIDEITFKSLTGDIK